MRIAFIILSFCAIGMAVVHIRAQEKVVSNKICLLQKEYQTELPRQMQKAEADLAMLCAPQQVQQRAEAMALQLIDKDKKNGLAQAPRPDRPRRR